MGETTPTYQDPIPAARSELSSRLRKIKLRWWTAPLWALAFYVSTHEAAKALVASLFFLQNRSLYEQLTKPQMVALEAQRSVQRHFLSFNIYIPLEDIAIRGKETEEQTIIPMLEQFCGEGKAFVWVPLRFQLPVVGEKVLEWCLVKA